MGRNKGSRNKVNTFGLELLDANAVDVALKEWMQENDGIDIYPSFGTVLAMQLGIKTYGIRPDIALAHFGNHKSNCKAHIENFTPSFMRAYLRGEKNAPKCTCGFVEALQELKT